MWTQSKLFFKLIEGTSLGKYPLSAKIEPHSLFLGVSYLVEKGGVLEKGLGQGFPIRLMREKFTWLLGGLRIPFKFSFKLVTINYVALPGEQV